MDHLFTLRVPVNAGTITIHAYDGGEQADGHHQIDVEVRHAGKVIFPRGATWCAVNRWTSIDGIAAKELVLSLVAMKPGDTDQEYFASYTEEQLDWIESYGEEIDMVRMDRYCDPETGECRRS